MPRRVKSRSPGTADRHHDHGKAKQGGARDHRYARQRRRTGPGSTRSSSAGYSACGGNPEIARHGYGAGVRGADWGVAQDGQSKRRSGEILALEGATRGLRYPTWQVTEDGRPLPDLPFYSNLWAEPWTVYRFLLQRHGELDGETGLDTLKRNRVEKALAAARNVSEGIFA